jgi:hypothetical protein
MEMPLGANIAAGPRATGAWTHWITARLLSKMRREPSNSCVVSLAKHRERPRVQYEEASRLELLVWFPVVDSVGRRHNASVWRDTWADNEIVYRLDGWQHLRPLDDDTFVTAEGEVLRRKPTDG